MSDKHDSRVVWRRELHTVIPDAFISKLVRFAKRVHEISQAKWIQMSRMVFEQVLNEFPETEVEKDRTTVSARAGTNLRNLQICHLAYDFVDSKILHVKRKCLGNATRNEGTKVDVRQCLRQHHIS